MKVFITGATGFIGSAIIPELLQAGHKVLGLTRSDEGAQSLLAVGAEVHRGSLQDLDSLRKAVTRVDAVIHCAFNNDFAKFEESNKQEGLAIDASGSSLQGSDRPLLITSVAAMGAAAPGQLATEDHFDPNQRNPRKTTENAGAAVAERGVNVSVVRLPQVHNRTRQGIVTRLIQIAGEKQVSAYVGDGMNRWAAAHALDVAVLYRLALEKAAADSRYHAVAEEGISLRVIAETIGKQLNVPAVSLSSEEAKEHFGALAMFVGMDMSASSAKTRQLLGWQPTHPTLIKDLEQTRVS